MTGEHKMKWEYQSNDGLAERPLNFDFTVRKFPVIEDWRRLTHWCPHEAPIKLGHALQAHDRERQRPVGPLLRLAPVLVRHVNSRE